MRVSSKQLACAFLLAVIGLTCLSETQATAASKKKILFFGDSLAVESFRYASAVLTANKKATVTNYSYAATSPCDWSKHSFSGTIHGAIIETVGANMSPCQKVDGKKVTSGTQAYWDMYERDLTNLLQKLPSTTVVWLTSPPVSRDDSNSGRQTTNKQKMFDLMQKIAAARPNTFALNAGAAVENPDGTFAASLPCMVGEICTDQPLLGFNLTRAKDGLHFCPLISVTKISVSLLQKCSGAYASGAWRFGQAQATPVAQYFGL